MGWIGWEPEVALRADVNLVELALNSRSDLLAMIFGDGKKRGKAKGKVTAADFRSFAASHNAGRGRAADG